jgi:Uma2 family endonuclease
MLLGLRLDYDEDSSMSTGITTLADMLHELGDIPPERIRWKPYPGTATEKDLIRITAQEDVLLELVDGVLVEKAMSYYASRVAAVLIYFIELFLDEHDLGVVATADGTVRLARGLVRVPDVAYFPWRMFPNRELPSEPIPDLAPELAIEVLSDSNTPGEMARKYREYFDAGVRLVWEIDPDTHTADVYIGPENFTTVAAHGALDGADVLPGFRLELRDLFRRAGQRAPRKPRNGKRRKNAR